MPRTFCYARCSTPEQNTQNQLLEIRTAGFAIEAKRAVAENISGSVSAKHRPGFSRLLDRLEEGDVLVVTKLDRLGRNAMDVRSTVECLAAIGVKVHCLALGGVDLTSPAGKMTMAVISAVAEFERDLLLERTNSGIRRARAEGRHMGRPCSLAPKQKLEVLELLEMGNPVSAVARRFGTTRQTIMRVRSERKLKMA